MTEGGLCAGGSGVVGPDPGMEARPGDSWMAMARALRSLAFPLACASSTSFVRSTLRRTIMDLNWRKSSTVRMDARTNSLSSACLLR